MFASLSKNLLPALLIAGLLLCPLLAEAAVYRYVDEQGKLHFTNVPTTTRYRFYRGEGEQYRIANLIQHYARRFRLDAALIKAVIKVESDFNPRIISHRGAQGLMQLMQLMPGTAQELGVSDPFDPTQGIFGGSFYLRKMLDSFDSNLDYALAAYNAGPSAVRNHGGIPPYGETRNYVKQVKHYLNYYQEHKDRM